MIFRIQLADAELRLSGKCEAWFRQCDEVTKKVSAGVNGYLFEELLRASHYTDMAVVELFRFGSKL